MSAIADAHATAAGLSAEDLADLFAGFQSAAEALQTTHNRLRSEVGRLETELRQTRNQLRRARELAALGEMAAGIAHEIRNPLGSIKLYASALADDVVEQPPQHDLAQKVVRGVDRLDAIVTDVLAFARELRVEPREIDPRAVVEDAFDACRACAAAGGVELRAEIPASKTILADANLLHQALVNVVRNACEALAESPTDRPRVVVSLARKRVRDDEGRAVVMLGPSVADNGPGIPEHIADRVFNPFFTTRNAGSGLGLAIVHRILDAHGGRVGISAGGPPGRGAVVDLLVPESPRPVPTPAHGEHA